MSSQQVEVESDITETNDSDTTDSYQVVSSTTDDIILKKKGNIKLLLLLVFTLITYIDIIDK